MWSVIVFFILMITGTLLFQTKHLHFEDYAVSETFKRKPAKVDWKSHPEARTYKTKLRSGAAQGPNFAGHYRLVVWGCGTACQAYAIVNLITGKVFMARDAATNGLVFRRDSKLLIVDPIDAETVKDFNNSLPEDLMTRYYVWDGRTLTQIDSSKSVIEIGR